MSLPGLPVRRLLLAAATALLAACGPIVERAPFVARPDTVSPGDLLGPFEGMVVDADTDRPVSGALVVGSWAFERGIGLHGPLGAREQSSETGPDGRYAIPRIEDFPGGLSTRIRRFTLIVYQRGYVGWRSDRRFRDGGLRRDFSQRGCRIRLEPWGREDSHVRHLVFLGGGSRVRAAAAWEVQPASMELEGISPVAAGEERGERRKLGGPRLLDVSSLLGADEVREVTGYVGAFAVEKLADLPTTEFYDSRHFKAEGKPESYDVALRVWRLGTAAAEAQYRTLLGELPGAVPTDEIGDASLRARRRDILGLAFLARDRGVVVSITCGVSQCTDPAMILKLAKLVDGKLGALFPAAPAGGEAP